MRWLVLLLACLSIPAQARIDFAFCLGKIANSGKPRFDLAKECPKLHRDLQQQKLLATLEPQSQQNFTPQQLAFLRNSQSPYQQPVSVEHDQIDQLLADLLRPQQKNDPWLWWRTFLNWLDGFKSEHYQQEFQWLQNFLAAIKPSEQTLRTFFYGFITLLVIASVALVAREIHLAGGIPLRRFNKSHQQSGQALAKNQPVANPFSADAPVKQQIAEMLTQTLDKLAQQHGLPRDPSLSFRQVLALLTQRQTLPALNRLVLMAEPVLFGNQPATPEAVLACRQETQNLFDAFRS